MKAFDVDVVFGASGGIGIEISKVLAQSSNSKKIVLIHNGSSLTQFEGVEKVELYEFDVESQSIESFCKKIFCGKIRLVLAHGVRLGEPHTADDFLKAMRVNCVSSIEIIKSLLKFASEGSRVIVLSSIAQKQPSYEELSYASSKAALSSALESLQVEATKRKMSIVDIRLGATRTAMCAGRMDEDKLICPKELGEFIVQFSGFYHDTFRVPVIEILRSRY